MTDIVKSNLQKHLNIAEYIQAIFIYIQVKIYSQHVNQIFENNQKFVGVLLPSLIEHKYNDSYVKIFVPSHKYIRIYY